MEMFLKRKHGVENIGKKSELAVVGRCGKYQNIFHEFTKSINILFKILKKMLD